MISEELERLFAEQYIEDISYKLWTSTDHCTILNIECCVDDFIRTLVEKLNKLVLHDFIAKSQNAYFTEVKNNLEQGDLAIVTDFAENYAFVVQDAAQAFHWNNDQATLLPMVIYYRENDMLLHHNFMVVSNCLKHDTVAVYMYQKELLKFLKSKFDIIRQIYYFSDGAPQQFKNKKAFSNIVNHFTDFEVPAEWHFFATAHGKGACDGLAGSVKNLATRTSLQKGSRQHILTALELFQWASENIKNVNFIYVQNEMYEKTEIFLKPRYAGLKTVKGTQSYHAIVPLSDEVGYAYVKTISKSSNFVKIQI